jgi:hypothetical protein
LVKLISVLNLILIFCLGVVPAAEASFCRQLDNHSICIVRIKRSAKNYWEYRAVVSIDGKKKPMEIYNCRDKLRVQSDNITVPFKSNGVGKLLCSLFDKK